MRSVDSTATRVVARMPESRAVQLGLAVILAEALSMSDLVSRAVVEGSLHGFWCCLDVPDIRDRSKMCPCFAVAENTGSKILRDTLQRRTRNALLLP